MSIIDNSEYTPKFSSGDILSNGYQKIIIREVIKTSDQGKYGWKYCFIHCEEKYSLPQFSLCRTIDDVYVLDLNYKFKKIIERL